MLERNDKISFKINEDFEILNSPKNSFVIFVLEEMQIFNEVKKKK